jgi:hypothetical protein
LVLYTVINLLGQKKFANLQTTQCLADIGAKEKECLITFSGRSADAPDSLLGLKHDTYFLRLQKIFSTMELLLIKLICDI